MTEVWKTSSDIFIQTGLLLIQRPGGHFVMVIYMHDTKAVLLSWQSSGRYLMISLYRQYRFYYRGLENLYDVYIQSGLLSIKRKEGPSVTYIQKGLLYLQKTSCDVYIQRGLLPVQTAEVTSTPVTYMQTGLHSLKRGLRVIYIQTDLLLQPRARGHD